MTAMVLMTATLALAAIALAHTLPTASVAAIDLASEPHRSNERAVKLLAGRYSRGEITADEYRRMLVVLKP